MAETTSTGIRLKELDKVADECSRIEIVAEFHFEREIHTALIVGRGKSKWIEIYTPAHWSKKCMSEAMRTAAASFGTGSTQLKLETITVKASKSPLKPKELHALVVDAYCEACGIKKPSSDELENKLETARAATADATNEIMAELRGGADGIAKWNARPWTRGKRIALEDCDLAGCDLSGVNFANVSLAKSLLNNTTISQARMETADLSGVNLKEAKITEGYYYEVTLDKATLTGCIIHGTSISRSSIKKADLENTTWNGTQVGGCSLKSSVLRNCKLEKAKFLEVDFGNTDLTEAKLKDSEFRICDFRSANLAGAVISSCALPGSDFRGACLRDSVIEHSDLEDVDFRGTDLSETELAFTNFYEKTKFDETTKFRSDFEPPLAMAWKGKGPHPYKLLEFQKNTPAEPIEFPNFMTRIANSVDKPRYKKVLSMLKADRFQLFSKVDSSMVLGVVRSQTDEELVYGCRLAADGSFCCCTQNLNACGGLRGQICKHILVLVIGLVKADELEPMDADTWTRASTLHKPDLGQDRDAMAELFLQYAGAQAGEIDWRPTETIPEDYYAF